MKSASAGAAAAISTAEPEGMKLPTEVPCASPLVMASKPPPSAPAWKQPLSLRSMMVCSVSAQPLLCAKVVLPSARSVLKFGSDA